LYFLKNIYFLLGVVFIFLTLRKKEIKMNHQSFESILGKYLEGKCTHSERLLVEHWYDLIGDEAKIPESISEWESLKTRMWIEIQKQNSLSVEQIPVFSFWKVVKSFRFAASILLFLGLGIFSYYYFSGSFSPNSAMDGLETTMNTTSKNSLIHLDDGSSIRLSPNAKLSYPKHFTGNKREVYLEGDAFFEIAKNPTKPFYVYTKNLVTKVIGTSFLVKSTQSGQVKIIVQSGKVTVFKKEEIKDNKTNKIDGVVILPNQQLDFDESKELFSKSVIEKPVLLTTNELLDFNFEDVSANVVLKQIQKAYGISIIYDEDVLKDCPFTADLTDEPLFNKISLLCQAIEANYQTIDGQIIISSKGCK
jgi:transmembrane sensor